MDLAPDRPRPIPGGRLGAARPVALGVAITALFLLTAFLLWFAASPNPLSRWVLGIRDVPASAVPTEVSVTLTPRTPIFSPVATVVVSGGSVTFINQLTSPLIVRSAERSPAGFVVRVPGRGHGSVRLLRPGLYHYYDARSARPVHVVANNQVIVRKGGSGPPRQGWIAVLPALPGLRTQLVVPKAQDLFMPKTLVTVVGSTIVVSNHDADAHNFVVDPASPSGAAFIIDGTTREPPHGWQRSLIIQQAGLYHIYCTLHTRVIGVVDGWHIVVPRPKASGYRDHNPMDAWIIALPATALL